MTAHEQRRLASAERYAAGDKSDPFTLARCQAHMRNGISDSRAMQEPFLWRGAQLYRYRVTVDGKKSEVVATSGADAIERATKQASAKRVKAVRLGPVGTPKMERITPEPYAHYDAVATTETRILQNGEKQGESYQVPVYRNMVRP